MWTIQWWNQSEEDDDGQSGVGWPFLSWGSKKGWTLWYHR